MAHRRAAAASCVAIFAVVALLSGCGWYQQYRDAEERVARYGLICRPCTEIWTDLWSRARAGDRDALFDLAEAYRLRPPGLKDEPMSPHLLVNWYRFALQKAPSRQKDASISERRQRLESRLERMLQELQLGETERGPLAAIQTCVGRGAGRLESCAADDPNHQVLWTFEEFVRRVEALDPSGHAKATCWPYPREWLSPDPFNEGRTRLCFPLQ